MLAKVFKTSRHLKLMSVVFVFFIIILVFFVIRNADFKRKIIQNEVSNIELMYHTYNEMKKRVEPMSILIKNIYFEDKMELIDEFRGSTPLVKDIDAIKPSRYSIIFKFYGEHETDRTVSSHKEYTTEVKEDRVELFGVVGDKGHLLISKDIHKTREILNSIEQNFTSVFVFLVTLMLVVLYLIRLSFVYEERKKELEEEHKELEEDVKKMAFVDILTKAYTRLKFSIYLTDLIEITKRFEQPFGLILFDIDNFKKVNDTFGHDYGDVVLVELAKKVKSLVRKSDIFARWGGEEFVVVLPQTDLKSSLKLAEKIRLEISKIEFDKLEKATCSFGVVEYKKGDDEDSIVKRADEFLYKAKKAGKNCVRS